MNNLVIYICRLLFGGYRSVKISVGSMTEKQMGEGWLGGIGLDRGDNEVAFGKEHTVWESR